MLAALPSIISTSSPKHVLLVVIDDLGFDDLGFQNKNQILTPNFNTLHDEGIDLSSYYVQPSCSPTRAAILSGRKPLHTGINFWLPNIATGLALNEVTLAQVLGRRGFTAHAVGKWHLGFYKTPYTPTFRGFSSFYGYYEGSEDYFKHTTSGGYDFHDEPTPFCGYGCTQRPRDVIGQYSTNLFSSRAVQIIEKHDTSSSGLFLYLAYQGVHAPREAPDHYVQPYAHRIKDKGRRTFAGMIAALDEGIGNVTSALRRRDMLSSTLIIVTTDNGGPTTECSTTGQSNWPLRGSKCSVWEGGTRGTAFIYWKGLPKPMVGSVYGGLMHAADLMPTIVTAIGSRMWPNETQPLDGIDLWGALMSNDTSPRESVYYGISQQKAGPAVRDAMGYKLIVGDTGGGQGAWSAEQLPNASSSSCETEEDARVALPRLKTLQPLLYYLPSDAGEHTPLDPSKHADTIERLMALISTYEETKVPQVKGDPKCPPFAPLNSSEGPWIGPWCDGI